MAGRKTGGGATLSASPPRVRETRGPPRPRENRIAGRAKLAYHCRKTGERFRRFGRHGKMHNKLTVRYRSGGENAFPPFSGRNISDLSRGSVAEFAPPPGFADAELPVTGATLAECLYLSGLFAPPALCSGIGRCGLCRVRFLSDPPPVLDAERAVLSRHGLDAGWRLACRHGAEAGAHVLVPAPAASAVFPAQGETAASGTGEKGRWGLAVDLGTTSIHWRVVPLENSAVQGGTPHGILTNPQMGAGSDVISRLAYAAREGGAAVLRNLVTETFGGVIRGAARAGFPVEALCVAANPAMTAIFLGLETGGLAHAPYSLPCSGNRLASVPGLPPVYVPPLIAPFLGGDVSAGYAALALDPAMPAPAYPFLLADLGTNGECVLALSQEESLAASLPMGPALEGINLTYGSAAVNGAVTDYALTPHGLEPVVMGGTAPSGITATGYLSLLRILLASRIIDEDGLFARDPATAVARNINGGSPDAGREEPSIRLPGKMALFASDVEEILKVKAAFTLAVSHLLRSASLPASKLSRVYLAGSLGANVSVAALSALGFLPPGTAGKVVLAGNTSLAGAALLLGHPGLRDQVARWGGAVTALDLAADPNFGAQFARHMVFAWRS